MQNRAVGGGPVHHSRACKLAPTSTADTVIRVIQSFVRCFHSPIRKNCGSFARESLVREVKRQTRLSGTAVLIGSSPPYQALCQPIDTVYTYIRTFGWYAGAFQKIAGTRLLHTVLTVSQYQPSSRHLLHGGKSFKLFVPG